MVRIETVIERRGGVATTAHLLAAAIHPQVLRMWIHDRAIRVRRGVWASRDAPSDGVRALQAGGRLGCVSAVAYWAGVASSSAALHVCLPANAKGPLGNTSDIVIHWSRADLGGDPFAVSVPVARAQMARCGAVERYP